MSNPTIAATEQTEQNAGVPVDSEPETQTQPSIEEQADTNGAEGVESPPEFVVEPAIWNPICAALTTEVEEGRLLGYVTLAVRKLPSGELAVAMGTRSIGATHFHTLTQLLHSAALHRTLFSGGGVVGQLVQGMRLL